jgi:hypothetical protein
VETGGCGRSNRRTVSSLDKRGEGRSRRQYRQSQETCTEAPGSADWTDPFYFKRRRKVPQCANLFGAEQDRPIYHHADRMVLDCSPRFDWSRKAERPSKITARELRARLRTDLQRAYDSWVGSRWSTTLLRTARALMLDRQKPADIAKSEGKTRAAISLRLTSLCQKDKRIQDWWDASRVPQFQRPTEPIGPSRGHPARVVDPWLEVVTSGAAPDVVTTVAIRTARTQTPVAGSLESWPPNGVFGGLALAKRAIDEGLGGPTPMRRATDVYVIMDMLLEGPDVDMRKLLGNGPEHMLDHVVAAGLLVPLDGLRLHFFGAVPARLTREERMQLLRFWRMYLASTGAELVTFSVHESFKAETSNGVAAVAYPVDTTEGARPVPLVGRRVARALPP